MNWTAIGAIGSLLAILVMIVIAIITWRKSDKKPNLFYAMTIPYSLRIKGIEGQYPDFFLNSQSISLYNKGDVPANNVVIRHNHLTENIVVYPSVGHQTDMSLKTITIPILRPKEGIFINYLFSPPPLTPLPLIQSVVSNEGFARHQTLITIPPMPKQIIFTIYLLAFIGVVALFRMGFLLLIPFFK